MGKGGALTENLHKCSMVTPGVHLSLSLGAHNATGEVPHQLGLSESIPILCSRVNGYHLDTPSPGRFSSEQTGRAQ